MNLKFYYILFLSLFFFSCNDNDLLCPEDLLRDNGSEVKIEVLLPSDLNTRGISDESKTSFNPNELIHIRAVYKCRDLLNPGKYYDVMQYGVMKYNGKGSWSNYNTTDILSWPETADFGTFTAYYINGSNGVLANGEMPVKLLSEYKFGEDPLCGFVENVEYGHAVRFEMKHIFTHLTLSEMDGGVSNEMFFSPPLKEEDYKDFKNAFTIEFNSTTREIKPVFKRVPSEIYTDNAGEGLVFVEDNIEFYETNDGNVKTRVGYFLEPKVYHNFVLLYPRVRPKTATYLSYSRDLQKITGDKGLEANNFYDFSVLKSLGVKVEESPENGWDDDSDPRIIIDVEEFLKAAKSGYEYWEEDPDTGELVQILETTLEGSRLIRNVDFNHEFYDVFQDGFIPDLSMTFDGGYHYIYNMACPLFNENYGNIINLGLVNIKTNESQPIVSSENYNNIEGRDFSRNGIISRSNFGTVSNIRVRNLEMIIEIETTGATEEESSTEAHSAAMLFGSNRGNIYDVSLSGDLSIKVRNHSGSSVMPGVSIGGITGQNLGTISRISPIMDVNDAKFPSPKLKIINECKGSLGVYIIGGVSGNNTGNIYDVNMSSVVINGAESSGVESIMGGIVGEVGSSNSGAPMISGCITRGSVTAGLTKSVTNIISNSYTGGVAGLLNTQAFVINSSASVSVSGLSVYDSNVKCAVGGAFGRIEQTPGTVEGSIQTLACFGSSLSGVGNIGNFAGIAPIGFTWEKKYADKGINVKQYAQYNIIGANL